jgi:thiosulfate dehydrogenase (quinone) large subunit
MDNTQKTSLFLLRIALGWMFFYAGVTKILDPNWSAAGYLKGAKTAVWFYQTLLQPNILPTINFLNEWGLTLLGISLLLGVFVRLGSIFGSVLMFLYYLPILNFPFVGEHALLVDEHLIYIAALAVLGAFKAGRAWGIERWCASLPICARYPKLRGWFG